MRHQIDKNNYFLRFIYLSNLSMGFISLSSGDTIIRNPDHFCYSDHVMPSNAFHSDVTRTQSHSGRLDYPEWLHLCQH